MVTLIADIETCAVENFVTLDGCDVVHCIVTMDADTGEVSAYHDDPALTPRDGSILDGLAALSAADRVAGHNWQGFDERALRRNFPAWQGSREVFDTIIAARVLWSDLKEQDYRRLQSGKLDMPGHLAGRQSLESWGYRLRCKKGEFGKETDWSHLSQSMLDYCIQDVRVNAKLYHLIQSRMAQGAVEESVELEHRFASILARMGETGFTFDLAAAQDLCRDLEARKAEIAEELIKWFPEFTAEYVTPKKKIRKTKKVPFNPGSRLMMAKALTEVYGWKPTQFTGEGRPKMDEAILEKLPYPEAKLMAAYLTVGKRLGQLAHGKESWLNALLPDGRIHGSTCHNGTVTHRVTHSKPNMGQVPGVTVKGGEVLMGEEGGWGYECRSLFTARKGWSLVGVDASGLQLRGLAHYLGKFDGGHYRDIVLNGDIHTAHMEAMEMDDRGMGKTFTYAWLFGAGDRKLAKTGHSSMAVAKQRRELLVRNIPGLGKLKARTISDHKRRGFVPGLGRRIPTRNEHSALNTLLMGFEAIVMKLATVRFVEALDHIGLEWGLDYAIVAHVHDEFQVECLPELAQQIGEMGVAAIEAAGAELELRCPLAGEYKIGSTWAETH